MQIIVVMYAPSSIIEKGISFNGCDRRIELFLGDIIIQFIKAPTIVAIEDIIIIGVAVLWDSSSISSRGVDNGRVQIIIISIRVEYAMVRLVAAI